MTAYVTGFRSVAVLYTLHGERPPAVLTNVILLLSAVYTISNSPGDVVICVDYHVFGGSWLDCSIFTACLPVITLTALQTAGVFLSFVHDYRAFGMMQAVLQTATIIAAVLVVSSHYPRVG